MATLIAHKFCNTLRLSILRRGCGVSPLNLIIVDKLRVACAAIFGSILQKERELLLLPSSSGSLGVVPLLPKINLSILRYLIGNNPKTGLHRAMNCSAITFDALVKVNNVSFYLPPRANSAGKTHKRGGRDF